MGSGLFQERRSCEQGQRSGHYVLLDGDQRRVLLRVSGTAEALPCMPPAYPPLHLSFRFKLRDMAVGNLALCMCVLPTCYLLLTASCSCVLLTASCSCCMRPASCVLRPTCCLLLACAAHADGVGCRATLQRYHSHDTSAAAAFAFKTIGDLDGITDVMSWWTFSDIFEEVSEPPPHPAHFLCANIHICILRRRCTR